MKRLPTLLAIVFVIITLFRVAQFSGEAMKAGYLGWLFSIGLGASVFATAYWTRVSAVGRNGEEDPRSKRARTTAWISLVLFVCADGAFNLWEVQRSVTDTKLQTAAAIYGLFPTLAVALLGALQGFVDRIPTPPRPQRKTGLRIVIVDWINHTLNGTQDTPQVFRPAQPPISLPQPAAHVDPIPFDLDFTCADCGRKFEKQQGLAAHMRRCNARVNA